MAALFYFGRLTDVTGTPREDITIPDNVRDTDHLRKWLDAQRGWNGALQDEAIRIAVNDELTVGTAPINNSDEIGFLPPVGGG